MFSIHSLVYGSADGGGGGVPGAAPAISDRRFKAITTLIVVVTLLIGESVRFVGFFFGRKKDRFGRYGNSNL